MSSSTKKVYETSRIVPTCYAQFILTNKQPSQHHVMKNDSTTAATTIVMKIEVWTTSCIVTNFGKGTTQPHCTVLVNPCNAELSGVRNFPYFPRGGPVPVQSTRQQKSFHRDWQPPGYVSNWGGMEVGYGMMYPTSVIDGLVHQLGGESLRLECTNVNKKQSNSQQNNNNNHQYYLNGIINTIKEQIQNVLSSLFPISSSFLLPWKDKKEYIVCPVGTAVETSAGGPNLQQHYDTIIHTTPPFYLHDPDPEQQLYYCYRNALDLIYSHQQHTNTTTTTSATQSSPIVRGISTALPLLGAGARGCPYPIALDIAASAITEWCGSRYPDAAVYRTPPPTTTSTENRLRSNGEECSPYDVVNDTTTLPRQLEDYETEKKEEMDGVPTIAFGLLDTQHALQLSHFIETKFHHKFSRTNNNT